MISRVRKVWSFLRRLAAPRHAFTSNPVCFGIAAEGRRVAEVGIVHNSTVYGPVLFNIGGW
jgi:hypothetical protein